MEFFNSFISSDLIIGISQFWATCLSPSDRGRIYRLSILSLVVSLIDSFTLILLGIAISLASSSSNSADSGRFGLVITFIKNIFQADFSFSTLSLLTLSLVLFLVFTLASLFAKVVLKRSNFRLAADISSSVSEQILRYISRLDFESFSELNQSKIIHLLTKDQRGCGKASEEILVLISSFCLAIFLSITVLFIASPLVVTCFALIVVLYILAFSSLVKRSKQTGRKLGQAGIQRLNVLRNFFAIVPLAIVDNKVDLFVNRFILHDLDTKRISSSNKFITALPALLIEPTVMIFGSSFFLFVLVLGLPVATYIAPIIVAYLAIRRLIPVVTTIYSTYTHLSSNLHHLESVNQFLATESYANSFSPLPNKLRLPRISVSRNQPLFLKELPPKSSSALIVDSISFQYKHSSKLIYDDFSFIFSGDRWTVIEGQSGSGKSTLISIILGLLPLTTGSIFIRRFSSSTYSQKVDADIPSTSSKYLANISYVSQDVTLIDGTIADNVAFSDLGSQLDYDRIANCCSIACIDTHIESLPDRYDTRLSSTSSSLSGGQKQRLAIARSLYKNSDIYIFDEITSSQDTEFSKLIISNLCNHLRGKVVILITHKAYEISHLNPVRLCLDTTHSPS